MSNEDWLRLWARDDEIRAEFEPSPVEIVATGHWCSSGLANTDLDLQLKKRGLIASTCVEATACFAAELGYEVTVVKDATADYADKEMQAALDVNLPNYASAVVTTNEIVDSLSLLTPSSNSKSESPGLLIVRVIASKLVRQATMDFKALSMSTANLQGCDESRSANNSRKLDDHNPADG